MVRDFPQLVWDEALADNWRALLALALVEDLGPSSKAAAPDSLLDPWRDLTSETLVPPDAHGQAAVVARTSGVLAGLPTVPMTIQAIEPRLKWTATATDGQRLERGARVGILSGPARGILAAERLILNTLGRLSGIATLARCYVNAVEGTKARIYDTRKTTPGWRRLEKYAVRCGGGRNHREALFSSFLIKDNHLALGAANSVPADGLSDEPSFEDRSLGDSPSTAAPNYTPAQAVRMARDWLQHRSGEAGANVLVEVEVDSLAQLEQVLPERPDIVLLDNMGPSMLCKAIELRDRLGPGVELEASGGITLETVGQIAATGVERISVGGLTHSAMALDLGLDWL